MRMDAVSDRVGLIQMNRNDVTDSSAFRTLKSAIYPERSLEKKCTQVLENKQRGTVVPETSRRTSWAIFCARNSHRASLPIGAARSPSPLARRKQSGVTSQPQRRRNRAVCRSIYNALGAGGWS
jgi:hypothetical protein